MNIELWYLKGKPEPWAEQAAEIYQKKISHFFTFQRVAIRSKSLEREDAEEKKRLEGAAILDKLQPSDVAVLFDEGGKVFKNSVELSHALVKILGQQSKRVVFIIGGPYGFAPALRERAQARWSLSGLTMNHHVAQVAALEQIYRGLTIWRGLPYHNE